MVDLRHAAVPLDAVGNVGDAVHDDLIAVGRIALALVQLHVVLFERRRNAQCLEMAKFRRDLHCLAWGEEAVLAVLCGQRLQRVRFVPLRKPAGAVMVGEEGIIEPHAHIPERQGEDAVRSVRIIGMLMQIARDPMLLVTVIELHETHILQIIGLVLLHLDFLCHRIELISLRERQTVFPGIELEVISAEGIGRQTLRVSLFILHDDARGRH